MGQDGSRRAGSMVVIHQAAVLEEERRPQQQWQQAVYAGDEGDESDGMEPASQVRTEQRRVVSSGFRPRKVSSRHCS